MCKLIIEQGYNRTEFEYDTALDAAFAAERLKAYATQETNFTIQYELKAQQEGESENEV